MNHVTFIAEAGVNHNGDLKKAFELVDVAAEAGADFVKFQTFKAEALSTTQVEKADYQKQTTGTSESQFAMLKQLELSPADHHAIVDHCRKRKIAFLSTAFDEGSLDFLIENFDLPFLKIPSGEATNAPFLLKMTSKDRPLVFSTGMCDLEEIRESLGVLAFGFMKNGSKPGRDEFRKAFDSPVGQRLVRDRVTLLHCTTEYPAPIAEANLSAMDTMKREFGLKVGYSDHTLGIHVSLAAVALGATVVEKHFTLDRSLPGPDHKASLTPSELKELVSGIRDLEVALGTGEKRPTFAELNNRDIARKTLVASKAIRKGERFGTENMTTKRAGTGTPPIAFWDWVGRIAERDYEADEKIG